MLLTLIPPSPPKKYVTPTLIPPSGRSKFKREGQTKNHYVDELAPLNRYLFIYLFTYLLIPCDPRDKQIKIPASNWSELNSAGNNFICYLKHEAPNI